MAVLANSCTRGSDDHRAVRARVGLPLRLFDAGKGAAALRTLIIDGKSLGAVVVLDHDFEASGSWRLRSWRRPHRGLLALVWSSSGRSAGHDGRLPPVSPDTRHHAPVLADGEA